MQYIAWAVVHLAALILMLVAAAGAGHTFLRKFRFHSLLEQWIFTIVFGLGLWALALFLLGLVGLLYRQLIVALTTLIAIVSLWHFVRLYKGARLPDFRRWKSLFRLRNLLAALIIGIGLSYWIILVRLPQYPPMSWDSTAYHLVLAKDFLRQHQVAPYEGIVLPVVPALNHMLFVWAMAVKDDILAQLIEHTLMMLTALGLYAWGMRLQRRAVGVAVAAFFLGQPQVVFLGESAYVDMGVICFAFFGIYAMRIFWDERDPKWWYLGMMLLAMAGSIKFQGLVFLGVAALLGLISRMKSVLSWKELLTGCTLGFLVALPWCAFIAYHTGGNPFWPAIPALSQGIWRVASDAVWLTWGNVGMPKTPINFILLPINLALDPMTFIPDGHMTLLPLIAGFPLAWIISIWNRSVRWWTLWVIAYSAFWFLTSQQMRFWAPAIPLVGLALYESIAWILERTWNNAAFHTVIWLALSLFCIRAGASPSLELVRTKGWPPPTTEEARDRLLTNFFTGYSAVKYINRHADPGDAVYSMNGSWLDYYYDPKVLDASGLMQIGLQPTFHQAQDEEWVRRLDTKNVKWIFTNYRNATQVVQVPQVSPTISPFWPEYDLVYMDAYSYVFRRKPVPDELERINVPRKDTQKQRAPKGTVTIGVYRASFDTYLLNNANRSGNPDLAVTFGIHGDIPLAGDWDNDGTATIGVFRPSESIFYLRNSNTNGPPELIVNFGEPGDIPVAGDWDGDGATTVGVYRPSTATFLLKNANVPGEPDLIVKYGKSGDIPIVGDWDGNGTVTIGVYRPETHQFLLRNSNTAGAPEVVVTYGETEDIPLAGDWDGDGAASIGVFRPNTSEFLLRIINTAGAPDFILQYGVAGDIPVVGNWDGR